MKPVYRQVQQTEPVHVMETERDSETLLVTLVCSFSSNEAEEFRKQMLALELTDIENVVLDMRHVRHLTSAGLGALIAVRHNLINQGIELKLANLDKEVMEVFVVCNAANIFEFAEDARPG